MLFAKLTPAQNEDVQNQLMALLARQAELYTMGESSSIPTETAQELLDSILYTLELALLEGGRSSTLLPNGGVKPAFLQGQTLLEEKFNLAKQLFLEKRRSNVLLDDPLYRVALQQDLPKFFHDYDWRYFAQRSPILPDHLLAEPLGERRGISYVLCFLQNTP
ncbi:MAG: DUF6179 domain-containing protein [Pseudoflavonifractor sp.]